MINFIGKGLGWTLQSCKPSVLQRYYKETPTQVFSMKFEKFLRTPILNLWTTTSVYSLRHYILIFTIHYSTCFAFLQWILLYYTIKTIERVRRFLLKKYFTERNFYGAVTSENYSTFYHNNYGNYNFIADSQCDRYIFYVMNLFNFVWSQGKSFPLK